MSQLTPVTPAFLEGLRAVLPAAVFREAAPHYLDEPRGLMQGKLGAVLAPGCTEHVSTILKAANQARVPVVPYGGGTGLVGGQIGVGVPDPLVLSLERLTNVRSVSRTERVLNVEAGVTLAEARSAAAREGMLFPLMLASEGSARIGGNLATNAGGMNVLRYGNSRDLCLGVEAVLADGTVLGGMKALRKDNTGYDLRNLLIGSEGTLGVITAANLRLFPRPGAEVTAALVVESPVAALELLALAGDVAGEMVSIFELISGVGLDFVAEHFPQTRQPFAVRPEWMVLLELGTPASVDARALAEDLLTRAMEAGLVADGVIAQSVAQRDALIGLRETIPAANKRVGAISSHDISLPLAAVPEFISRARAALLAIAPFQINCFGHLGDGNLHFNVFPPKGEERDAWRAARDEVARTTYDLVHEMDGSFSAEHGVGRLRVDDLARYGDAGRLAAMKRVKAALDPVGILNPGALFPVTGS